MQDVSLETRHAIWETQKSHDAVVILTGRKMRHLTGVSRKISPMRACVWNRAPPQISGQTMPAKAVSTLYNLIVGFASGVCTCGTLCCTQRGVCRETLAATGQLLRRHVLLPRSCGADLEDHSAPCGGCIEVGPLLCQPNSGHQYLTKSSLSVAVTAWAPKRPRTLSPSFDALFVSLFVTPSKGIVHIKEPKTRRMTGHAAQQQCFWNVLESVNWSIP